MFRISTYFYLSLAFCLTCTVVPAHGDERSQLDRERLRHEIASEVMSPFCPGRSLNDCPSSAASGLKVQIEEMLAEGKSKEQVMDELYQKYGEEIRALPQAQGIGLLAWISPIVFLAAGLSVLSVWLKKHRPAAPGGGQERTLTSEMKKRIDEEVYGKN